MYEGYDAMAWTDTMYGSSLTPEVKTEYEPIESIFFNAGEPILGDRTGSANQLVSNYLLSDSVAKHESALVAGDSSEITRLHSQVSSGALGSSSASSLRASSQWVETKKAQILDAAIQKPQASLASIRPGSPGSLSMTSAVTYQQENAALYKGKVASELAKAVRAVALHRFRVKKVRRAQRGAVKSPVKYEQRAAAAKARKRVGGRFVCSSSTSRSSQASTFSAIQCKRP